MMQTTRKGDPVRDFVRALPDEDLRFLQTRLGQRLGGDIGDAVAFAENSAPDLSQFMGAAESATDYYARIDHIEAMVQGEARRRTIRR